ncbi:MAG: hypothetical protein SCALA702_00840 [Melioribacteraceae bacterium]|nr:MAG: hypothetical protein SCALA702_00840 [Melioribacteraceae bacterium]
MITKSVQIGDIDSNLPDDSVMQIIRDQYLRDTTVTVVLIGSVTCKKKHVDWKIGSSISDTKYSSRSGLRDVLLPSYHSSLGIDYGKYNHDSIPPRSSENIKYGYSNIYDLSNSPYDIQSWIHNAFDKRTKIEPDNSHPSFKYNR